MNKFAVCDTRMRFVPLIAVLCSALVALEPAHTQAPPKPPAPPAKPAGPTNLVSNGSFETGFRSDNLWNGVNSAGYLAGERGAVAVLTLGGTIADQGMPLSVSVADMNGDGLLDIGVMDVIGYFRIYFNSGTPQEPKFTVGELASIFLTRIAAKDPILNGVPGLDARMAPRIHLTDIMKSGKKDLILGNYFGEIMLIPNDGTLQRPDFRQPSDLNRVMVPTMKDVTKKWGNVFSPVTWDWNKDGKDDILLGEGSYSANNIHLLLNMGSGAKPVFDESNRHIIAYGDGNEQLAPTVVDYNGDGNPDLLVADRTGQISLYLNKGEPWTRGTPPPEIPFTSLVGGTNGSAPLKFNGISTIATGDFNGDGLFDLVVGKANGRISMVLNTGTKLEPKFATQTELKGTAQTVPYSIPSNWEIDYGLSRGNFYGFISVVKGADDKNAAPTDGASCLKIGYMPSPNTVMAPPSMYTAALGVVDFTKPSFGQNVGLEAREAAARTFVLRQFGRFVLKTNVPYTLSFKVKGKFSDGLALVGWQAQAAQGEVRVTRSDRGGVAARQTQERELGSAMVKFSGGGTWTEVKTDFKVDFKDPGFKDLAAASTSYLQITMSMPQGGEAYIDDVKIVERK